MTKIFLNDVDVTDEIDATSFGGTTSTYLAKVTSAPAAPAPIHPDVQKTLDYLGETYPEDEVILRMRRLIQTQPVLWEAMLQFDHYGWDSGDGITDIHIATDASVRDAIRVEIVIQSIIKEIMGKGGRSPR